MFYKDHHDNCLVSYHSDYFRLPVVLQCMCVSLLASTTDPSASDGTGVQLTVIVAAVLLTRVGEEGTNPGAERITFDIM